MMLLNTVVSGVADASGSVGVDWANIQVCRDHWRQRWAANTTPPSD